VKEKLSKISRQKKKGISNMVVEEKNSFETHTINEKFLAVCTSAAYQGARKQIGYLFVSFAWIRILMEEHTINTFGGDIMKLWDSLFASLFLRTYFHLDLLL
jgi:hypothetical protein